jgi:hypothetical protein
MMVYKYWDSFTKDDLEFRVGGKIVVWEVKGPLLTMNGADYSDEESNYHGGHPDRERY